MNTLKLDVLSREERGRSKVRKLRNAEKIPAIIYRDGDSRLCSVPEKAFLDLRREMGGTSSLIELNEEGGNTALTLIKDVQRNSISQKFVHIDFLEVAQDKEFTTSVGVVLTGESIGVKLHDGILQQLTSEIPVRCLPKDMPATFELDISELNLGDTLSVKDLSVYEGVQVLLDDDQLIATCTGSAGGRAAAEAEEAEKAAGEEATEEES